MIGEHTAKREVWNNLTALSPPRGDQAQGLRRLLAERTEPNHTRYALSVAVAGGKGGVGKTLVALHAAHAWARMGARVLLFDGHRGVPHHEFLCGVHGAWQLRDWVTGGRCLSDVLTVGPDQITLCAGLQALTALQHYPSGVQQRLLSELEGLERQYDVLLIDTGEQNWSWIGAADVTVVVTTPQPVSLAATYALLKQCTYARYTEPIIPRESSRDYDDQDLQLSINSSSAENSDRNSAPSAGDKPPRQTLNPAPWLVINQAESAQQAEHCVTALRRTCRLFLDEDFAGVCWLPYDPEASVWVQPRIAGPKVSQHSMLSEAIQLWIQQWAARGHASQGGVFERWWRRMQTSRELLTAA